MALLEAITPVLLQLLIKNIVDMLVNHIRHCLVLLITVFITTTSLVHPR